MTSRTRNPRGVQGTLWLLALAPLAAAVPLAAQDPIVVRVRVVSVSADSVYLDQGRAAGLAPGLEVELSAPGAAPFRATIREVSATSARAEIPPGRPSVPVGTMGEVTLPSGSAGRADEEGPQRARTPPAALPWKWQDFPRGDTDSPLLAPAFGGGPASRPADWSGRLFGQYTYSADDGDGRGHAAYRARLGARTQVTNLLGQGETLAFDGELRQRGEDLFDEGEDTDSQLRIDRLSYAYGEDVRDPWRLEMGRFVSRFAPELGLVDGAEGAWRTSRNLTLGGGLGLAPLPFPDRETGDDFGVYGFAQWRPEDDPTIGFTLGVQKTWHRGTADRDLLFARFDWQATERLRFDASTLVDFYTASDDLKDASAEVTQGFVATRYRASDAFGFGITSSTYAWAQLLRADLAFAPPELIRDGRVDRLSPRVWWNLGEDVRLQARVDHWSDQNGSGTGGELSSDWYRAFGGLVDLGLALSQSEGSYTSGPAVRFRAARTFDWGFMSFRYEWSQWSADALATGTEDFSQHRTGVDASLAVGDFWNVQIQAETVLGDLQDGYNLGFYVQRRF
ncbi:MAG: hypothetical protein ACO3RU_03250 [Planctomycetota bacterium]